MFSMKLTNDEAMAVFDLSHQRSMLIPQIIFYCQTMKLLSEDYYMGNQTYATSIEQASRVKVDYLSTRYRISLTSYNT